MRALKLRNFGLPSKELSSVNMVHESKLYNRLRMRLQTFVSIYRVYSVSTDNILM
jgi:hypothetical protein